MTVMDFNQLTQGEQVQHFKNCCGAQKWVQGMVRGLPYGDAQSLLKHGEALWYNDCNDADWLEAFTHHPRIGDKNNISDKVQDSIHLAVGEQSGVQDNDERLLLRLHAANIEYEARFGFTFIVFASGKSGAEMLSLLESRLENSKPEEMHIAMGEQWKITSLRLKKLLTSETFPQERV